MRSALKIPLLALVMGLVLSIAYAAPATAAGAPQGSQSATTAAASGGLDSGPAAAMLAHGIPKSATGCSGTVCIAVCNNATCTGHGLYVLYVAASGTTTKQTGCAFGKMLVRGKVREVSNPTCWDNPPGSVESLFDYFPVGYRIDDGSQVCVQYSGKGGPSGKPCETVHS